MQEQLSLFDDFNDELSISEKKRAGTFIDNMSLPIHRWFKYSAGFGAQWVGKVLSEWNMKSGSIVLDPFVGSGTVPLVCDSMNINSIGVEAHPFAYRVCNAKLHWDCPPDRLMEFSQEVLNKSLKLDSNIECFPDLIQRSYDPDPLRVLANLKTAWLAMQNASAESELVWLAITSILRITSTAGTAQCQYIQPNKTKKNVTSPLVAYQKCIDVFIHDLKWMQYYSSQTSHTRSTIIQGDARNFADRISDKIDAVITSPPYANNFDYADALRFEMTFWGDVASWGDIHDAVRKYLMVSSSQHSSREKLDLNSILLSDVLTPIRSDLEKVVNELAIVRLDHGGKKHYHTMIAAYCRDIGLVMRELRKVCKPDSRMCWVIGDSAPYGVYCPIEKWIGDMAISEGFSEYSFEKLRDRNIKWKNRKHRVPLQEGLLWIKG